MKDHSPEDQPECPQLNFGEYRARRVFCSLDGIRALSILAVIWHHATPHDVYSLPILDRGFLGVDMFFVLSGFLIVTLLLRESERNGRISLSKFYARRTLRIFPVYYAVLCAVSAIYLLRPNAGGASAFFSELPFYATYTSNWIKGTVLGLTWSLATEEQFYLFWPPVERYLRVIAIPLLIVLIGISELVNFGLLDVQLQVLFPGRAAELSILQVTFTPICMGVLIAHLLHHERGFGFLSKLFGWRHMALVLAATLFFICDWPREDISGLHRLVIHLAMSFLLVSLVVREDGSMRRILSFEPVKYLGKISYGMYLFHTFAVMVVSKVFSPLVSEDAIAAFMLTTLLTVGVAGLSYRFFESPIMRWKQRFSS